MLPKLYRFATLLVLAASACLSLAQTEEEDMNFAVAHMGMQVARLVEGDETDRSASFPKGPYGDITKALYGFVRAERIRVLQLEFRTDLTDLVKVASLEWTHSPKAALREIGKNNVRYGAAKIAQLKGLEKLLKLISPDTSDSQLMGGFKTGMRDGFSKRFPKTGKDSYTPYLIFLSKLEEIYQHLDQNRADILFAEGPFVVFKTESNNLVYSQKAKAMGEAAEKIQGLVISSTKDQEDALKRMRGLGGSNG